MTAPPTLGIALSGRPDYTLARFLVLADRWVGVRYADALEDGVDAWLVTDDVGINRWVASRPLLVWTRAPDAPAAQRWPDTAVRVVPCASEPVGTDGALRVPEPGVDLMSIPFVAPLVRRRWRERYQLPDCMVVRLEGDRVAGVPKAATASALAVGSAATATGADVLTALAWGLPTVTDPATASRLALDGVVEVAEAGELAAAAERLCGSDERMAELAWAGRRRAEDRFDLGAAVVRALAAVGVGPRGNHSHRVLSCLQELWASPESAASMVQKISGG